MRKFALFLTFILVTCSNNSWATTKPSPGNSCTKAGITQISGGIKYTCVKSGKKLVWNSGVKILFKREVNPTPPATPIAQPSPKITLNDSCTNRYEKILIDGNQAMCTLLNSKLIWQKDSFEALTKTWIVIQKIKNDNSLPSVELEIKYSPTVSKNYADIQLKGLLDGAKFWQKEFLPKSPMPVLLYSEKDRSWYEQQFREMGISEEVIASKLSAFDAEVYRNNALMNVAGMNGASGKIWFEFAIGSDFSTNKTWETKRASELNSLKVGPHEYTHSAQYEVIVDALDSVPCWFLEGGAEFYGMVLGAPNSQVLKEMRYQQVWEPYRLNFPGMSFEPTYGWEKFLENNKEFSNGDELDGQCGPNGAYPVGSVATQYLFELKGQEGIIQFMQQIRISKNWKYSLLKVYGIPWEQMKSEMAAYIRLIVAQTPK